MQRRSNLGRELDIAARKSCEIKAVRPKEIYQFLYGFLPYKSFCSSQHFQVVVFRPRLPYSRQ